MQFAFVVIVSLLVLHVLLADSVNFKCSAAGIVSTFRFATFVGIQRGLRVLQNCHAVMVRVAAVIFSFSVLAAASLQSFPTDRRSSRLWGRLWGRSRRLAARDVVGTANSHVACAEQLGF